MAEPASPEQAQAPTPGQSPPGSSPATQPVPNRGQEAGGLAALSVIANALLKVAQDLGASSDAGRDCLKSASTLLKHVPPGSQSSGVQNNAMQKMMREQQAQQPMAAMMQARGGAGAPPPQAGGPPPVA